MNKKPVLAYEPEAVLTAWYKHIVDNDARPGHVVGQIIPGSKFVWEKIGARPSLARIDGIGIIEASPSEYCEVLKAIAQGQFQITSTDRLGQAILLHKATGLPLKTPSVRHEPDDSPSR